MQIARAELSPYAPTIRRVSLLARIMPLPVALNPPASLFPLPRAARCSEASTPRKRFVLSTFSVTIGTCDFHAWQSTGESDGQRGVANAILSLLFFLFFSFDTVVQTIPIITQNY